MNKTKRIAFLGLMLALMLILSFLEHMLPPFPYMPPGVKLGLANIVTMYCVFFAGKSKAVTLSVLKSIFVLLMRGPAAGILSLSGGLCAIAVIVVLVTLFRDGISYMLVSMAGAISHNIGQMAAASAFLNANAIFYYLPVLIVSGIVMGAVTGTTLKTVLPAFERMRKYIAS